MATKLKRINYPKGTTPIGVAVFPYLDKPDTKFGAPKFKVDLRLTPEAAAPIRAVVDDLMAKLAVADPSVLELLQEDSVGYLQKAIKLKKAKPNDPPARAELDKEGDPTGFDVLKLNKNGERKDKDGNTVATTLPIFDSKKKPTRVAIWGGSEIKASFLYQPWVNAKGEYGVKLALEAVQVIKLQTGGARDADGFGFGEEEGFAAPDDADSGTDTPAADAGGDDDF